MWLKKRWYFLMNTSMENYKYRSAHFVNLAERYAIDWRLLGRHFSFRNKESLVTIVFPSVIQRCGFPELVVPGLMKEYNVDEDNWGNIKSYDSLDKPESIDAWVSTVFVECYTNKPKVNAAWIENQAKQIVYALQIINPDAIRIHSDEVPNVLCRVKDSVEFKEDGTPQLCVKIATVIDERKGRLTFQEIKTAIKNANKSVSAPYEMVSNAQINLSRHDWRAAVLNCATAIEVMVKKKVIAYFETANVPNELREHVLKQADGFKRLRDLCKSLSISLAGMPNVEVDVMKVRHKVIHGGYVPTFEEAYKAYSCTRQVLTALNVPMFE